MAANKVKGIRAALCTNEYCAEMTRRHNNANILCMGGKVVNKDTALKLLYIFLHTEFEGGRISAGSTRLPKLKRVPFEFKTREGFLCKSMKMFSLWIIP